MSNEKFLPLPTSESDYVDIATGVPAFRSPRDRENHLFCGCCCDVRRATLVVNIITIVLNLIFLILTFVGLNFMSNNLDVIEEDMDDDEAKEAMENFAQTGGFALLEVVISLFLFVSIFLHAVGIYGALKFKVWAVAVGATSYGLGVLMHLLLMNFPHFVLSALFLYPHIILILEINQGIMTDYNYENVANCCGGV